MSVARLESIELPLNMFTSFNREKVEERALKAWRKYLTKHKLVEVRAPGVWRRRYGVMQVMGVVSRA